MFSNFVNKEERHNELMNESIELDHERDVNS